VVVLFMQSFKAASMSMFKILNCIIFLFIISMSLMQIPVSDRERISLLLLTWGGLRRHAGKGVYDFSFLELKNAFF
jgi:hypothetical protein